MAKFITHNDEGSIDTNMTHLQGYISATFKGLCKVFGKPTEGDCYKTDWEWEVEFPSGTVATIYNWKNGPSYTGADISPDSIGEWHIGGHSIEALRLTETAYQNAF